MPGGGFLRSLEFGETLAGDAEGLVGSPLLPRRRWTHGMELLYLDTTMSRCSSPRGCKASQLPQTAFLPLGSPTHPLRFAPDRFFPLEMPSVSSDSLPGRACCWEGRGLLRREQIP